MAVQVMERVAAPAQLRPAVLTPLTLPHPAAWPATRAEEQDALAAFMIIFGTIAAGFVVAAIGLAWLWVSIAL